MAADRTLLGGLSSGTQFLSLVDGKLAHDPKLQTELISVAAKLVKEAGSSGIEKENNATIVEPGSSIDGEASKALVVLKDIVITTPRGKFDVMFLPDTLIVHNAKATLRVPTAAVSHVAILDQIPQDTKGRVLLFIAFNREANIMNGKQRLDAIILQTLGSDTMSITAADGTQLQGPALVVLCQALGMTGITNFITPNKDFYQTAKGQVAVGAVVKASSGFLFPLATALAFMEKPALLLPHDALVGVEFRREQSSTFDLVLHLKPLPGTAGKAATQEVEFSHIDRSELGRLQSYVSKCKLKLYDPNAVGVPPEAAADGQGSGSGPSQGTAAGGAGPSVQAQHDDDDDDDEDDEDYDPMQEDDSLAGGSRRMTRKRRRDGDEPGTSSAPGAGAEDDGDDAEGDDDEEAEWGEDDEDEDEDVDLTDEEDLAADHVRRHISYEQEGGSARAAGGASKSRGKQVEEEDEEEDYGDDE